MHMYVVVCVCSVLLFDICQLENNCCFTILKDSHHLVAKSGYNKLAQLWIRTFHIVFLVFLKMEFSEIGNLGTDRVTRKNSLS